MSTHESERSDEQLLAALARSDLRSLEQLYERYKSAAYSLAYRIVGDRGAAEDVLQDAFLAVWRRAGSFRPERGSVRTWLFSVIHHRAIDRLRASASGAATVPLDELADQPSEQPAVWQQVWRGLRGDQVRAALERLTPEQKKSIELAYFSGYSQSEIAGLMGVPLGTVKGRMRNGLLKLRAWLEGRGLEMSSG
jgi:RNA polymerase sigma-70 factor, ECF subfamily